eukprot:CAMPEP_0197233508 /NCGR_PEP_ID=MMETSP1429-20130617/1554_1 /TAXON_ID=49237 /ORGANISM="Chaetoceros  sp., Strain UNC1202" /LENGTH=127 /DNA_ID=CAMNT_0042691765 /DNA_START=95 /DNA_END=475 /DNA_ORIENTATION=-
MTTVLIIPSGRIVMEMIVLLTVDLGRTLILISFQVRLAATAVVAIAQLPLQPQLRLLQKKAAVAALPPRENAPGQMDVATTFFKEDALMLYDLQSTSSGMTKEGSAGRMDANGTVVLKVALENGTFC